MKKRKSIKNNSNFIKLHVYGIFDVKKRTITKISLDRCEIQMELTLMGEDNLMECECDIVLIV